MHFRVGWEQETLPFLAQSEQRQQTSDDFISVKLHVQPTFLQHLLPSMNLAVRGRNIADSVIENFGDLGLVRIDANL